MRIGREVQTLLGLPRTTINQLVIVNSRRTCYQIRLIAEYQRTQAREIINRHCRLKRVKKARKKLTLLVKLQQHRQVEKIKLKLIVEERGQKK